MCISPGKRADQTGARGGTPNGASEAACSRDARAAQSADAARRGEQLELVLEPHPTYRLQRIDIKSGDAIDHIKYVTCRSAAGVGACAQRPVGARGGGERSQDFFCVADSRTMMAPCGATGTMEARPMATRWVRVRVRVRVLRHRARRLPSTLTPGAARTLQAILIPGEHLVRVTHERFVNYKCAGAAVEFETSHGRVFKYEPRALCSKWAEERETLRAVPGHEIVGLIIRRGVLKGSQQQPIAARHTPDVAAVVAALAPKEDEDSASSSGMSYAEFPSTAEAAEAWLAAAKAAGGTGKAGRAAVMVQFKTGKVLKTAGSAGAVKECAKLATEAGYIKKDGGEGAVSMINVISKLYTLLSEPGDALRTLATTILLGISFYLELEIKLIQGHVMTMVPVSAAAMIESAGGSGRDTAPGGGVEVGQGLDAAAAKSLDNQYVRYTCDYLVDCAPGGGVSPPQAIIITFMLVAVCERLAYVTNVWIHHRACHSKNFALKVRAFEHVLSLDQAYYDTHSTSEIRGGMNVHALNNLITWNIPYLVTLGLNFVMTAVFMCHINLKLGCICVAGIFGIKFGLLEPLALVEKAFQRVERKLECLNNQIVDEAMDMTTSIKLFSKEQHHVNEFNAHQGRSITILDRVVLFRCIREFCYGILRGGVFCVAMYHGIQSFAEAGLSAADLAGFFLLLNTLLDTFGRIKFHYDLLVREFSDIERFLSLMEEKPQVVNSGTQHIDQTHFKGEIEFRNVRFCYPSRPGEEILKGLNLKIQPHKMTAIVGDSGAGKSTITKLVSRLYDPQDGQVLIDGVDVKDLELSSLHSGISIVSQTPTLFNASLADNIGYGACSSAYSMEEVKKAAALANCDFVDKFRGGFDTFAGAGGGQLSGGQKQRIAIARAAIRHPRILILDEATSALDAENEMQVTEALENVMKGRTTLVIAHRLSTVKSADDIVCMKDGAVCERGTHAELMKLDGVYANLVSKQLVDGH